MRVALVSPMMSGYVSLPNLEARMEILGLAYLSSALQAHGHETVVVDPLVHRLPADAVIRKLREFEPDVVGFSVTSANVPGTLQLSAFAKRELRALTVVGGIQPSARPEMALEADIDLVVLGEGDETILEIVSRYTRGEPPVGVAGTAWCEDGELRVAPRRPRIQDLDALPFPDRRFSVPKAANLSPNCTFGDFLAILTSRGCAQRCGFCASPIVWEGKWIARTPENVLVEIDELIRSFGVRSFVFQDEDANFGRERALHMWSLLREHTPRLKWFAQTTVRSTDLELAEAMVDAGLDSLFIGFESGSPTVLKRLSKRFDPEHAIRLVKYFQRRGVYISGNFILGLPWESRETLEETYNFARRLNLDISVAVYYRPQRNTPFHRLAVRDGLVDETEYDETKLTPLNPPMPTYHLSSRDVERSVARFMYLVYGRPTYWIRIFFRVLRQPRRLRLHAHFCLIVLSGATHSVKHKLRAKFRSTVSSVAVRPHVR